MKRLNFVQGSAEWHAHRATARNASEVSAVLGCSPYMTRSELLHAMHTGIRPEPTREQERIFADGHAIEAAQRPAAARVIGEELYPVVGAEVVDGIELSASFDGLTMAEDIGYECKTLNDDLRAALSGVGDHHASDLPKHYRAQMEQQLMVCGGERILFVAATKDGSDVRRCWYYPDQALRAEILAAWRQFEADLAAYQPPAAAEKIVAEPVQALPAVAVQVSGALTITDNFRAFEVAVRDFLQHRLIREPKTDQDFADLDQQIKAMKGAEDALQAAEAQMLAQIQSVDQAKKTKDMLHKLVRDNRLMAEKLLAAEKERRKGEIVAGAIGELKAHIDGLNARLGKPYMPATASAADFGGVIRGLKSLASMEEKVGAELLRAKLAASQIADQIDANLRHLREHAGEHRQLFPDTAVIVLKAPEDLQALVSARIAEHKASEERRLAAERERIRAEEAARADREARERAAAEQRQREEAEALERRQREANAAPAPVQQQETVSPPAAANVVPMPTKAPAASSTPTLMLREINARLAPLSLTAEGLAALGFPHSGTDRAAKLYHEHQFAAICDAVIAHAARAKLKQAA